MTDETTTAAPEQAPLLRVVTPNTTPEEIAAIVAVFSALGGAPAPARKAPRQWNAPHRLARRPMPHGVGGWRTSGLPR